MACRTDGQESKRRLHWRPTHKNAIPCSFAVFQQNYLPQPCYKTLWTWKEGLCLEQRAQAFLVISSCFGRCYSSKVDFKTAIDNCQRSTMLHCSKYSRRTDILFREVSANGHLFIYFIVVKAFFGFFCSSHLPSTQSNLDLSLCVISILFTLLTPCAFVI